MGDYTRLDTILAVHRPDRPLPVSPGGSGDLLYGRLPDRRWPAASGVVSLLLRSERLGGGGVRAGAGFGTGRTDAAGTGRCLRGADQLWIHADDAGTGSGLVCLTRAGAAGPV